MYFITFYSAMQGKSKKCFYQFLFFINNPKIQYFIIHKIMVKLSVNQYSHMKRRAL